MYLNKFCVYVYVFLVILIIIISDYFHEAY